MATAYKKEPSDYVEFETEIGKWQFNELCLLVGRRIENQFARNEKPFDEDLPASQKYQSAVQGRRVRKVKIKPNGTW